MASSYRSRLPAVRPRMRRVRMARGKRATRGMSLIELMVGVTVLAFTLMLGIPSFGEWIRNTQVRSAMESVQNGIQFARSEAVRRNTAVRFQLVSTLDSGCAASTSGNNWLVNMTSGTTVDALCDTAVSDSTTPFVLQASPAGSNSATISLNASRAVIGFNGLGRQIATTNPTTAVAAWTLDIGSTQGTCVASGGTVRCLRVTVSTTGQVRSCDPNVTSASDPLVC